MLHHVGVGLDPGQGQKMELIWVILLYTRPCRLMDIYLFGRKQIVLSQCQHCEWGQGLVRGTHAQVRKANGKGQAQGMTAVRVSVCVTGVRV